MPALTLQEIAQKIGGELHGPADLEVRGTAEIDKAGPAEITFLANPKYRRYLEQTRAAAVIIDANAGVEPTIPYIKTPDAYYGFLQAFLLFNPPGELIEPGIHPSAVVSPTAQIGNECAIGANVYIGERVTIGERTRILPNCVILNDAEIGADCLLYPLVSIREGCRIGNRVILHNGVVIGSDGFGFAPYQGRFHKIPQLGIVVLEDDVELGANCAVDRATMGETRIKTGVKLDNMVQIAHNVVIGEHTVMAAQTGISGSTKIGKQVMIGGQVGMVGHITIGDRVQIGAKSGVAKAIPEGEVWLGAYARPMAQTKRIEASLSQLPELIKRVRKLEKEIESLKNDS